MIIIPVLLLALLVVLAGLFLLAKARNEKLGRTYIIASYVAAGFGILVFVFGITAGILMAIFHCKHGMHGRCTNKIECPMMRGGCGGHGQNANCGEMGGHNCSGSGGACSSKGNIEMKMHDNCCHDGKGDKVEVKEVIIKQDGDEKPEIKVEVEGKTK